jgi:hypothetical protein
LIVSIFAYYQWNDVRRELSLDKFYDRLSLINERYYYWPHARDLVGHFWPNPPDEKTFQEAMYVYLELDNLEYIIMRYHLGFVSRPLLKRAVRTFSSRCQSSVFSSLARQLVNGAGYSSSTIHVVSALTELALASKTSAKSSTN